MAFVFANGWSRGSLRTLSILLLIGASACAAPDEGSGGSSAPSEPPAAASPVSSLPATVAASIEAAGGWEAWRGKRDVDYVKTTRRFGADGAVESERVERHRYLLDEGPKIRLEWTDEEGREVVLIHDGQQAAKLVDGEPWTDRADRDHAWNSTTGSHYMFGMPFKLADPGAILSEVGPGRLPDGTSVVGVRADYEPGAGTAGGMHTWTYYFDADSLALEGFHLRYGEEPDDHSLSEVSEHREVDGILLIVDRSSYGSNAAGERLDLRSRITLDRIAFDSGLDEALFEIPSEVGQRAAGSG